MIIMSLSSMDWSKSGNKDAHLSIDMSLLRLLQVPLNSHILFPTYHYLWRPIYSLGPIAQLVRATDS